MEKKDSINHVIEALTKYASQTSLDVLQRKSAESESVSEELVKVQEIDRRKLHSEVSM